MKTLVLPLRNPQKSRKTELKFAHISDAAHGIGLVLLILLLIGCARKTETSVFVARVDNEYLTPDQLKESLDTALIAGSPQLRDFVTHWVNSVLLYEEAKARGLDRSVELNKSLEDIRRQLAVNRLIETEVYTEESLLVTDEEIKNYYDERKDEYVLIQDVAKIQYVLFFSRDAAVTFRSQVLKNKVWVETLRNLETDSAFANSIFERADSEYIRQNTPRFREIWRTATQLRVGEISAVVKEETGYYVVGLLGMQRKGEIAELALVEAEVRDRVVVAKRQRILEQFLEQLRKKHTVQVNLAALEVVDTAKDGTQR